MRAYAFREKHRVIPMVVNHVGPYFLDVVMVEHPTEQIPGRSNLMALNGRQGMLTKQWDVKIIADARAEKIWAALEALVQLNDQEIDWVAAYVKSPHHRARS